MGDREKACFFPATIAYQLCRSKTSCRDAIKKTLKQSPEILSQDFASQFRHLLFKTAGKRWSFLSPITIVIDALDECDDLNDQVILLNLILETVNSTNTRFLIASRPEHHIHAFFQRKEVSQHTYHIRLDEESFNTSRDIEVFLRDSFKRIRELKPELCPPLANGEDWPGNVIIIRIRDDSDSQFIYPTLIIAYIDTPFYPPDQQLQALLSAPPPRAFSKLDALYERILSRCPPDLREGSGELLVYQKLVQDILGVVVAWSEPVSVPTIAGVLKRKVDVVQNIIMGPMRSLFKFDRSNASFLITLCHKSLRDYLLDIERSHKFFIPSSDADALFVSILSRTPPADRSYTRDELTGVLAAMVNWPGELTFALIAGIVDVGLPVVEYVVLGPARALFDASANDSVKISTPSLKVFLHDITRSGQFFVQGEDLDTVFTRILSRQPPSDPLHSYSRDDLLDVLTALVGRQGGMTGHDVEELLFRDGTGLAKRVSLGPAKALFATDAKGKIHLSIPSLKPFLLDASRAGEFFIEDGGDPDNILQRILSRELHPDPIFLRILSRRPPSDPSQSYSHELLMGVLTAVLVMGDWIKVPQIASALNVAPSFVEGIIFGSTKALFKLDGLKNVDFSTPSLRAFLVDPKRPGQYFIPANKPDDLFLSVLSRKPARPSQSRSRSRKVLKEVLMVLVVWGSGLHVSCIAPVIGVSFTDVTEVVFGWGQFLFYRRTDDYISLVGKIRVFLQDPSRAGEFYTPPMELNPNYDSLRAKISKVRDGAP